MKIDFKKDAKIIKGVLKKFFNAEDCDMVDVNTELELINFGLGTMFIENNKWGISFDYTVVNMFDLVLCLNIVSSLDKKNIFPNIYGEYHTIYNDDEICVGTVFAEDIDKHIKKFGVGYADALSILASRLIDEDNKEKEKVKDV